MNAFIEALQYIHANEGKLPPSLKSKEDQNALGHSGVPGHVVEIMKEDVEKGNLVKRKDQDVVLCLVDGFLLYVDPSVVKELDLRLLVRAPYDKLKARREARSGYVTIDGLAHCDTELISGFWEDPPGYFDKIVWKWYVKDHQHLFENNHIDGPLREDKSLNLQTPVQLDLTMQELLMWAMGVVSNYLEHIE
jgi:nicotinamide/nicotinate riboside kinase